VDYVLKEAYLANIIGSAFSTLKILSVFGILLTETLAFERPAP
jgi:hypothetical protein